LEIIDNIRKEPVKKEGMKFDDNKLQWHLLPMDAIEEEIKVLMVGVEKYLPNNWQKVPDGIIRYINASFRHLSEIVKMLNEDKTLEDISEMKDPDTGLHPLAHIACDIHFALSLLSKYNSFDDEIWKRRIKEIREEYSEERNR